MSARRILLAEDEVSSAEVLALLLSEAGYLVTLVPDGRQALARLEQAQPDLLVTDFMMPGINGAELVLAVRRLPPYAKLPVLLMSGAPEAAIRAYKVDYQGFLRKPFQIDDFLQAVARLLKAPDA